MPDEINITGGSTNLYSATGSVTWDSAKLEMVTGVVEPYIRLTSGSTIYTFHQNTAIAPTGGWFIDADPGTAGTVAWNTQPIRITFNQTGQWVICGDLVEPAVPAHQPPPLLNHRGTPARSLDKDKQFADAGPEELLALQLLRKMVSPDDFRRYLRHGFVPVRGASGLIYQVHRDDHLRDSRIVVWDRSEQLAQLCVHLKTSGRRPPPTDHVVGKILIIEYSEPEIWTRSNVTWLTKNRRRHALEAVQQAA